jgi:hypothetical protein
MKNKKNKIAIYTAIFGDYDDLIEPPEEIKGCDFYCFTDNEKLKSKKYKIIKVKREFSDPTRDARKIKTLSHKYLPNYEYTLWIDANIIFRETNIQEMFNNFLSEYDIAIHKHDIRDCVYDEFNACLEVGVDSPTIMASQMIRYINERYPVHNGLAATGVVFRRNSDLVRNVNKDWWNELRNGSKRDQLSIDYVMWKNKADYFRIDESVRNGKFFYVKSHKNKSYTDRAKNLELNEMKKRIVEMEAGACSKCYVDESKNKEIIFLKNELERKDKIVDTMENSIFWKIRGFYLKLKYLIFKSSEK